MRLRQIPGYTSLKKHLEPVWRPKRHHGRRWVKSANPGRVFFPENPGRGRIESRARRLIYSILDVISYLITPDSGRFRSPGPEMNDWMSRLYTGPRENTRIMESTMIGSHDAASYGLSGFGSSAAITQSQGVGRQLDAGVRYLDIRITLDKKGLYVVHHGPYIGKPATAAVVQPLKKFLEKHPDEIVVVKLQFSGMSKEAARKFLKTEFKELMGKRALSNRDRHGHRVGPGSLTFRNARTSGRNLLLTVSDEHMGKSEKLNQKELGSHAWLHHEFTNDLWPNSSDSRAVRAYTEEHVLPKMEASKKKKDGRLNVLQLQTNINPTEFLRRGISPVVRLAGYSNEEIPGMLKQWYKQRRFVPNIILQDFIGHYNYRDISLLALTFSTQSMSEQELKQAFPRLHRAIIRTRMSLET